MKRGDLDKRVMITLFCLRTTKTCCKIRRSPSDRPRRLMNLQESGQRQRKNPFFWSVACRRPTSEIHIIRNLDCNNKPTFRRLTKRRTHVRPFFYYNEPHLRCEPILAGSYSIFFLISFFFWLSYYFGYKLARNFNPSKLDLRIQTNDKRGHEDRDV